MPRYNVTALGSISMCYVLNWGLPCSSAKQYITWNYNSRRKYRQASFEISALCIKIIFCFSKTLRYVLPSILEIANFSASVTARKLNVATKIYKNSRAAFEAQLLCHCTAVKPQKESSKRGSKGGRVWLGGSRLASSAFVPGQNYCCTVQSCKGQYLSSTFF